MTDTHTTQDNTGNGSADQETESRARRLGWVDKEEFKGDPTKWRPADEFVQRGEKILPIVLANNERLQETVGRLERKFEESIAENKELKSVLGEMRDFARNASEREYKRAKTELESQMANAVSSADGPTYDRAKIQLDALEREKPKIDPAPKSDPSGKEYQGTPKGPLDPIIQDWIKKEEWFTKSPVLSAYAVEIYGDLEKTRPGMTKSEMLAETKRMTVDRFPEKFGANPLRNGAASVSEPRGGGSQRKKGKTYDDLPADAKAACDRYVKNIPNYKRDDYVRDYQWDD